MIQYEQATIGFPLPDSAPFHQQVRLAPTPISEQVAMSLTSTDGVVDFNVYVHLASVDPSRNRYRFYTLTWQPSLFGGGAIVRHWGRIGTKGQWRAIFFGTREEAQETVEETLKRRLGHGYQVVRWE